MYLKSCKGAARQFARSSRAAKLRRAFVSDEVLLMTCTWKNPDIWLHEAARWRCRRSASDRTVVCDKRNPRWLFLLLTQAIGFVFLRRQHAQQAWHGLSNFHWRRSHAGSRLLDQLYYIYNDRLGSCPFDKENSRPTFHCIQIRAKLQSERTAKFSTLTFLYFAQLGKANVVEIKLKVILTIAFFKKLVQQHLVNLL